MNICQSDGGLKSVERRYVGFCFLLLMGLNLVFLACKNNIIPATGVTISPATVNVAKGATQQFTATVTGTNSPAQTVTWAVTGGATGTDINTTGLLTVAAAETATTLTVKATSTVDTAKSGTAIVTVTGGGSNDILSGTVNITGTVKAGQVLTANTDSLEGSGTISYQWRRGDTAAAAGADISGAASSTYTPVAADVNKYIKVTVTRSGYTGSVTSVAVGPVPNEVTASTISPDGLITTASGYQIVTEDGRQDVMKVDGVNLGSGYAVAIYSLAAYKDKDITITLSVYVKRVGAAGTLNWQINNSGYPSLATINNAAANTWHSMSGTWTGTPTDVNPALYLSTFQNSSSTTTYYIDNFVVTVKVNGEDPLPSGAVIYTTNSGGNKALPGSPYGYEMWTEGGNNNKLTWYGPTERGGAAFRAEWNQPNDFLGRIGYYWGNGGLFTTYKNMYAEFTYTRSGRNTAGNYSYIGIYGWAKNPSAADPNERLIEYYIVEDWFGNTYQDDTSPMGTGTTGGSEVANSSYVLDGATYKVIKNVRVNKPSISGDTTFTQYFSIRQTLRKTGTISITEHFKKWDALGMKLGNMYECKFLVEAGGGTGWLEFSNLKFSQEENPR